MLNPLLEMLPAKPISAAEKLQVLPDGEVPVKRKLLRDVTHVAAGFSARRAEVEPIHLHETARRGEKPAENPEGHRFTGAVRAEEPEDFPRLHGERRAFHGGEVTELPDKVLHDNDRSDVAVRRPMALNRSRVRETGVFALHDLPHEGVFKFWRSRAEIRAGGNRVKLRLRYALFRDDADVSPLRHGVCREVQSVIERGLQEPGRFTVLRRREIRESRGLKRHFFWLPPTDQLSAVKKENVIRILRLIHIARGPEDRDPLPGNEFRDNFPEVAA